MNMAAVQCRAGLRMAASPYGGVGRSLHLRGSHHAMQKAWVAPPSIQKRTLSCAALPAAPIAEAAVTRVKELEYEIDSKGLTRVKYDRDDTTWLHPTPCASQDASYAAANGNVCAGWSFCKLCGHSVHFAEAGQRGGPVVLLVHGYGASVYHWRYQFRALADAGFHVFALDLVGFGLSEKASIEYSNGKPWVAQIAEFIQLVIKPDNPVILVGNSLGGFASLAAAADHPDLVGAVALLNGAGPTKDPNNPPPKTPPEPSPLQPLLDAFKRVVLFFAFLYAKQPLRIKQVLAFVYANKEQLDEDLVTSIQVPAMQPNASEVFFRVQRKSGAPRYLDDILKGFRKPLLLLFGDQDPWVVPQRGRRIKELYPDADLRFIPSGHCPHDDTPEITNAELIDWLSTTTMHNMDLSCAGSK